MTKKEESLINVLSYCSLRELPKKDDGVNVWIRAVALITKANCSQCYAYVEKGDKGTTKVMKDFGDCSPIYKIEEIYPFGFLSEAFMPVFKKNTKDERIAWLQRYDVDADSDKTIKELDKLVLDQAIKNNLKTLRNG